jgi:hypothetical protein
MHTRGDFFDFVKSMVLDELKEKITGALQGEHAMKSTAEAGPRFQDSWTRKVPDIAQLDSGESRFSAHDFG